MPGIISQRCDVQCQIRRGQHTLRFFGPLHQLQPRAGQQISKPRFFKLTRIGKAIQIEMPDAQLALRRLHCVGLDHGITGALHAALHAEGAQEVAHESRLASA